MKKQSSLLIEETEYLQIIESTLSEWNSEHDNNAYDTL
jgi:hypothetical protein